MVEKIISAILTLRRKEVIAIAVFLLPLLSFVLFNAVNPLPPPKPSSKLVLANNGELLSAYLSEDDKWRMYTHIEEVTPEMLTAIIQKEDRWFFIHPGVNPLAILRAMWDNLIAGKRTSGASTITMQVARLMEPKSRTIGNKIYEVFRALQLEWHYSKTEILEMYLSYLPYGGNVEGVKAASYIYFNKPPGKLSLAQCVTLAVIPNRPNSLRPDNRPGETIIARDEWLTRFQERGIFPQDQVLAAKTESLEGLRYAVRPKAPHFSYFVKQRYTGVEINTTIDPGIQLTAERLLANYVRRARPKGVSNGSVLILDNTNGAVLGYCGSADFYDDAAGGQVNGIRAIRSPGSTLKPAVYALGFDKGIYTPQSRLLDIPTNFAGYSPENYDLHFRGSVNVEFALRNSLNIPAVSALRDVHLHDFLQLMEDAQMRTITQQQKKLGLSAILGGCGVTLEELVRLFSAFAREGKMFPVAYTRDEANQPKDSTELFSPEAAWLIGEILSGIQRPDIPQDLLANTDRAKIAWKTGTSFGRRDAWSIGFTQRYTIGVWIGNFDGRGAPELSGATMAVPLLFDLFNSLEKGQKKLILKRPAGLGERKVCQETGNMPSTHCRRTVTDFYLKDISSSAVCDQEKVLFISPDSAIQYCTGCLPVSQYSKAAYSLFPAELTLWYDNNAIPYQRPPKHNPKCEAAFGGEGPEIMSPAPDYEYLLERGAGQEILLQAASDGTVGAHYWYVNGEYLGKLDAGEKLFYSPPSGKVRFSCMDDKGRLSAVEVVVKSF